MSRRRLATIGSNNFVPTIKDVAALAGVSTATVSRVLSGSGPVSEPLADKVHLAARQLKYKTNRVARSLRSRGTRIVGVAIPDIENTYFSTVICGIEDVLVPADYCLLLAHYADNAEREQFMLETLHGEGVAGLIFTPSAARNCLYREMAEAGVALVALSCTPEDIAVDSVNMESLEGAHQAVKHLLRLDHERIAILCGPITTSTGRDRLAGYRAAFAECRRKVPEDLITMVEWKQESAYRAVQEMLDRSAPPTAIFAGGNTLTLGALQAIHERRLDIPRDVALVGFDDLPWAASLRPSLTAVSYQAREMGQCAAQLLLDRIADPDRPLNHRDFPTKLVVRASFGAQWDW